MKIPKHYDLGLDNESIDIILAVAEHNRCDVRETWFLCNTLKYLIRHNNKGGIEDLKKAEDYLNRMIEYKEEGKNDNE